MPPLLATTEPTRATAGDTWQWQRAVADYPASEGWVLSYAINGVGKLEWNGDWLDADGETVSIPGGSTAALAAGLYRLIGYVTLDGERHTIYEGTLVVLADLAAAAAGTGQTFAEQALALVETQITALLATTLDSWSIGQRAAQRRKLEELEQLRAKYQAEIAATAQRARGSFGRNIGIRFTRPSW